jgi:hypothetical protein
MEERFTIGEAVRYGWDIMKDNLAFLLAFVLILWLAEAIPSGLQAGLGRNSAGLNVIFGIIGFIVSFFVGMAYIKAGLRYTAGEQADFTDLYSAYPHLWNYFLGAILYGLIVLGGLILCIIPGIYWGVKYQFFGYFIIDQERTPTNALTRSGQVTQGIKGYLFLFNLAQLGIMILGFLACIVGILVAIPVNFVAHAYVYRRLVATEGAAMQPPQPSQPPQPTQPGQQGGPPAQPPTV